MSKVINYYPGIALAKQELQFKDYSEKYLSLYVDLIRLGGNDVIFLKNTTDFQMSKGTGTPNSLLINEGFCLFNSIRSKLTDFEFQETLDVTDYPDQRFFVRKNNTDTPVVSAVTVGEIRYVYLESYLVPAAFKCTVSSDGVINTLDGGSISKSELVSILRGSNTKAPTRVRFMSTDFTMSGINNIDIYELNSVTEDIITVNGTLATETGTVLCIPVGSFSLGMGNNLENRSLFSYIDTRIIFSNDDTLDSESGIIKLGYLTFQSADSYTITDLRNDNKYVIAIDTDIDTSDFVTKSTLQTISGGKIFTGLVQNDLKSLSLNTNYSAGLIDIKEGGNEFIFNCSSQANLVIKGFFSSLKSFGTNPDTDILKGTTIKVRFYSVGNNTYFDKNYFQLVSLTSNIPIKEGITYIIRYESGTTTPLFSLSVTCSIHDVISLQSQISTNKSNIEANSNSITTLNNKFTENTSVILSASAGTITAFGSQLSCKVGKTITITNVIDRMFSSLQAPALVLGTIFPGSRPINIVFFKLYRSDTNGANMESVDAEIEVDGKITVFAEQAIGTKRYYLNVSYSIA